MSIERSSEAPLRGRSRADVAAGEDRAVPGGGSPPVNAGASAPSARLPVAIATIATARHPGLTSGLPSTVRREGLAVRRAPPASFDQ
jgi:hypothetical protein